MHAPGMHAPGMTPLPPEPFYLPFEPGPHKLTMGLVARHPDDLFEIDDRYPDEMRQRQDLLARHHAEIVANLPEADAAAQEVLSRTLDLLPRRYPDWFTHEGNQLTNRLTNETWDLQNPGLGPLELAARLVQEDLCIMRLVDGVPILVAGVVCFTTGWHLTEKLGLPLLQVHEPVPGYARQLGTPVDRLMRHLRPGKLVERLNWGLYDSPALFRPGGHFRGRLNPDVTAENAGVRVFLRVERQTLSALPASDSVLFTIRTHVYPVTRVAACPARAARLAAAIRALPPDMALYKSFAPFSAALLIWLDRAART